MMLLLLRFMKLVQRLTLPILWLQIVAAAETATLVVGHAPVVLTSWLRISNRIALELHPIPTVHVRKDGAERWR